MKKIIIPLSVIAAIVAIVLVMNRSPVESSMILVNGVIHTLNDRQPVAQAVAVKNGLIAGVGSSEEITSAFTSSTVVDLGGRTVVPGLIDAHAHIENLGAYLMNIDLFGTRSVEGVQGLIDQRAKAVPPGVWVRGRGWDQNLWPVKDFPHHSVLDAVAKDVPVFLMRVDGHAAWINGKALELAGITRDTPDPPGGRILRDADGNPTGVFIDNAVDLVTAALPPPSAAERTEAVKRAVNECLKVGLTEVHDMGADLGLIAIYKELLASGKIPLRIYAAITSVPNEGETYPAEGLGPTWEYYLKNGPEIGLFDGRLTVRALKLYADGALGSRGAALIEPYSDDPSNRGLTRTSTDQMKSASRDALRAGFQVCVHAIGDRANHITLNMFEEVLKEIPRNDPRPRIEHVQVLDANDIGRFHSLGILPSMQPTHCTSDMYWAEERLGPMRIRGAYAWRSLIDAGSIIPGGSDFPVESPNPLWGFYAAVTRQDHSGWPGEGWYSGEKMTRDEALKAFTLWAAYAAFEETRKGSIERGKVADFVVLSNDIMTIEPKKILETSVEMTVIGGEVVYSTGAVARVRAQEGRLVVR